MQSPLFCHRKPNFLVSLSSGVVLATFRKRTFLGGARSLRQLNQQQSPSHAYLSGKSFRQSRINVCGLVVRALWVQNETFRCMKCTQLCDKCYKKIFHFQKTDFLSYLLCPFLCPSTGMEGNSKSVESRTYRIVMVNANNFIMFFVFFLKASVARVVWFCNHLNFQNLFLSLLF